jgi:Protein of unknown function (DUF3551)
MGRDRYRNRLLSCNAAILIGVIAGAGMLDSGQSAAAARWQRAPWCAYLGGFGGNFDCSYYTFEQCMATARGLGGYCSPNPYAVAQEPYRKPRRVRR